MLKSIALVFVFVVFQSCTFFPIEDITSTASFVDTPTASLIEKGVVDEASGIADSRNLAGNVWVHNDGDNPSDLYLLSNKGAFVAKYAMPFRNRDWEDITIGAGPTTGVNYIYLADIGDNLAQYDECYIYRFQEPKSVSEQVTAYDKITFKYADGKYDAEAILLDPTTKDLYIVTKRETSVRLYKLAYPQSTTAMNVATFLTTLPFTYITSGGVSSDGKEILLKTYSAVYYWKLKSSESIATALSRQYDASPKYTFEPQGEGICFDRNNGGFYTISERPSEQLQTSLYFYAKK